MVRRLLPLLLIAGCTAYSGTGSPSPDGPGYALNVVSYNIHHGRGLDDDVDLERIADVLRRFDADVIALQEVDEGVERSGRVDQAARLGELLGMHHAFGSFFDYQGGRYGMAILSRCPIRRAEPYRLPDGNEPRIALIADIALPGGDALTVVDVHFDWVANDGFRFAQASVVAETLETMEGPFILIGDFNDLPNSRTLSLFRSVATEAPKPRGASFTFPSTEPVREIDYVFVSPNDAWTVDSVRVGVETMASDHRPMIASLRLRTATPETQSRRPECAGIR